VEIDNFWEAFEKGEDPLADITNANYINLVAGVLKHYLRKLREPVFSVQYFDQFIKLASKNPYSYYSYLNPLIIFVDNNFRRLSSSTYS
jgi:hypothetical protein